MQNLKGMVLLGSVIALTGCVSQVDIAVRQYASAADRIHLGDSFGEVRAVLDPAQANLPPTDRRHTDQYLDQGTNVVIYYARSLNQVDGLTTDDEFTPYIFRNGKLVAVGWYTLGGPHTQGQAVQDTFIHVDADSEFAH